ncbi:unnamed protein product [Periconia digitata]|uniref:Uncharacterized protein n=1 Tax=Periconia digitata TaxID=1303443 RepID=A0A9W4XKJ3_9PLEO|nr:unnamed protein product [Periconia digitata]
MNALWVLEKWNFCSLHRQQNSISRHAKYNIYGKKETPVLLFPIPISPDSPYPAPKQSSSKQPLFFLQPFTEFHYWVSTENHAKTIHLHTRKKNQLTPFPSLRFHSPPSSLHTYNICRAQHSMVWGHVLIHRPQGCMHASV